MAAEGFFKTCFKQRSMKIQGSPFYEVMFRLLILSDNIIVYYFVPLFSLILVLYSNSITFQKMTHNYVKIFITNFYENIYTYVNYSFLGNSPASEF